MKWIISIVIALVLLSNVQVAQAGAPLFTSPNPKSGRPLGHQNLQSECGCGEFYPRPNDAMLEAGAVFTGEVVTVADLPTEEADAVRQTRILFRVISSWKNAARSEITVDTGPLGKGCGLEFHPGEIWVVYMSTNRIADKCTRTRLLQDAGEDLAQLGPGKPPLSSDLVATVKPDPAVERLSGFNLYGRLALAALLLALCLGGPTLYYRRKRQATPT